jgi:hypothetical protein
MSETAKKDRYCPGASYAIDEAICRARQQASYRKCPKCRHRDLQLAPPAAESPSLPAEERTAA